jgi:hypothetical protein
MLSDCGSCWRRLRLRRARQCGSGGAYFQHELPTCGIDGVCTGVMTISYTISELREKSPAWLLAQRGSCRHDADTQGKIALEMEVRGLEVPPLPRMPVLIAPRKTFLRKIGIGLLFVVVAFVLVVTNHLITAFLKGHFLLWSAISIISIGWYVFYGRKEKDEQSPTKLWNLYGVTELMTTAASGDVERMNDLLNYGARVDDVTKSGLTSLMYAAANGQIEAYRLLLSRGADPNAKSKRGLTAMGLAIEKGFENQFATAQFNMP